LADSFGVCYFQLFDFFAPLQAVFFFLVINDMPSRWLSWQRDNTIQDASFKKPDTALSGDTIFPHQVSLAITIEIRSSGDMPASGLSWQRDNTTQDASLKKPDTAFPGRTIFPRQISLAITIEIRSSDDMPASGLSWQRDNTT
jgi:hypothetical protein